MKGSIQLTNFRMHLMRKSNFRYDFFSFITISFVTSYPSRTKNPIPLPPLILLNLNNPLVFLYQFERQMRILVCNFSLSFMMDLYQRNLPNEISLSKELVKGDIHKWFVWFELFHIFFSNPLCFIPYYPVPIQR